MGDALATAPAGFGDLSVEEQINYVQFLWERITGDVDRVPVPDWHRDIIEARLEELKADPDGGRPWEEARAELRERLAQGK